VVLSSPHVPKPVAARYAWANYPECNLYNKAGLPAPPFRTDDWPVATQGLVRTEALKLW
jgi:sialate O-acetylesterase